MTREQVYQRVVELIQDEKGEDFKVHPASAAFLFPTVVLYLRAKVKTCFPSPASNRESSSKARKPEKREEK